MSVRLPEVGVMTSFGGGVVVCAEVCTTGGCSAVFSGHGHGGCASG
jgi:hypothetical protein